MSKNFPAAVRSVFFVMFICALATVAPRFACAQTGTTSLRGSVVDRSGGALVGAKVSVTNSAQGVERQTTTNATGAYELLALQPGTYRLTVEMQGFRRYEQKEIHLLVDSPQTDDVILDLGSTSETVEVSAQAAALNTTDASLGNAFGENQVRQLPLEGRNVPDLLSLQPGVAYTGNRSDVPEGDTRSGAVNGARSDQSNVTVDGIAVNDEGGHAFTSVLPVTLDSVQEFRVTTSNYNADQGSTSGAQVSLVTKSGTNQFHGSAYEYARNTYTSANDYFVKASQIDNCIANGTALSDPSCNHAPKLIRNIFGASFGGPIKKDRLFFFTNFEGTRRAESASVTNQVPSQTMKDGIIQYPCADTTVCPGGNVTGLSGASYAVSPGSFALSPTQLAQIDPLHIGPNTAALAYLNTWPNANSASCGDGLNYTCFTFSGPISDTKNEYIAKMDYNITRDARHRVSVMGALRNESNAEVPFLPGQGPSESVVDYNKGLIVNYSGVLTPALINNFRYGFIRESTGIIGNSAQDWNLFRGLNDQGLNGPGGAITRTHSFQRPTHTLADDLSWIHGKHTWQFGTSISFIRTPSISYLASYSNGSGNASWVDTAGYSQKSLSPLNPINGGFPGVDPNFANSYDYPITAELGLITEVDARYNFKRDGSPLPDGSPLTRHFAINSYEFYGQDTWKLKPTFTVTLGLRWSLFSPPWETNKLQVSPTTSLDSFYHDRAQSAANGIPSNQDPSIAFDWSGPANGKPGYYNWDYKDFGPRVAFAWAPRFTNGLFHSIFGDNKTSVRAGFGMVYDRFGQGLVDDFNQYGSFGLSTKLSNPAGFQTVSTAPRLTDIHTIPTVDNTGTQIFLQAPPAVFPQTFPPATFFIGSSIDQGLKTPYAYTFDLSVSRELPSGFTLEVAYVGRESHRLLTQLDVAAPTDIRDKNAGGLDYFGAVDALAKLYRSNQQGGKAISDANFSNTLLPANVVKYWQDMIQPLQPGGAYSLGLTGGCGNGPASTTNPVLAAFDIFCGTNLNETTGIQRLDYFGIPDANNPNNTYYSSGGQFSFFNPQFATLYMFKSMGAANYNAMQVSLKHRMSHGVQFELNYTFSKSIDLSSDSERVGSVLNSASGNGGNGGQVVNSWNPSQLRGVSDFDATHQFNANWVADLPFGRGRWLGRDSNRALDALIGGWQLSGLFRLTSGFPFSVGNGAQWPTNWDLQGDAFQTAPVKTGTFHNSSDPSIVNAFSTGAGAQNSFVEPLPGQSGVRNTLRGPGYFSMDAGLGKRWKMPWSEQHSIQFRWEVFNVTNSVRFDAFSAQSSSALDFSGSSFGQYTRLSTNPRVMQFALRYEF